MRESQRLVERQAPEEATRKAAVTSTGDRRRGSPKRLTEEANRRGSPERLAIAGENCIKRRENESGYDCKERPLISRNNSQTSAAYNNTYGGGKRKRSHAAAKGAEVRKCTHVGKLYV